jgi:hypothetical protein
MPVDTYNVTASAGGFDTASRTAIVLEDQTTPNVDFSLVQLTGTIGGIVTDAITGQSIENATVTAEGGYTATTDSGGHYSLPDLPVGTYNVTASAAGYLNASQTVDVLENQTTAGVDFTLAPQPDGNATDMYIWSIDFSEKAAGKNTFLYVTVTISRDSDADGNAEGSDSEVEGATVSLSLNNDDSKSWTYTGSTDGAGQTTFTLKKAPAGTYVAQVTDLTHSTYTWNPDLDAGDSSALHTVH